MGRHAYLWIDGQWTGAGPESPLAGACFDPANGEHVRGTAHPAYPGGAFLSPTLVEVNDLSSSLIQDEVFGPFLVFETFADDQEAVYRANATRYGLAASVWTSDRNRAERVSRQLATGTVWINSYNRLFAEAETGGYRESGIGRLHGLEGLNDFLQTKHIYYETLN
jgi:betaine-aldehyde dehydrogenase